MKNIVIITHRYHYHICQIAILLAIEHFHPNNIAILFDDVEGTQVGWGDIGKNLLNDVKSNVNLKSCKIFALPFSSISMTKNEPAGWIRQQYVKLNLHKILPHDEWLVIDGDVLLNHQIDPWNYCYINSADPLHLHHDFFVRYALDLGDKRVLYNNSPVEFSSVPIRLISRKTLTGLENYIQKLHNTDIRGIRDSFTLQKNKEKYLELSEYDLIGNYQNFISNDLLPLENLEIYFEPKENIVANWDFLSSKITVLHGYDNLPIEWYKNFGININQTVWNLLYTNQKINC